MPTFSYTARSQEGESKSGVESAPSKEELSCLLAKKGFILISAKILTAPGEKIKFFKIRELRRVWRASPLAGRVSLVEKMLFARHLALMIASGLSLVRALEILSAQTKSKRFSRIIIEISQEINKGKSFSDGLSKYPKVFAEVFVNMVKVGETSGNLEEILKMLSEQMSKDHQLISKVRSALIYPAVIVSAMVGIGILMFVFVVPKLTQVFEELKVELPPTTRLVIALSKFLSEWWWLGILIIIILTAILKFLIKKTKKIKQSFHFIILHLPVLGEIIKKVNIARFTRTMSFLTDAGVSIVKSCEIVSRTLTNYYYRESLVNGIKDIQKGEPLSSVLIKNIKIYPAMTAQMIKIGEETGALSNALKQIADFYEEEIENITKGLSSIIEPALMIIIGAAVGFFAVSMLQPMYSLMSGL